MTPSAAHELVSRTYWSRYTRLTRLATQAQDGAVRGDLNAIARFVILSDQAFEAQRNIYGLKGSVDPLEMKND